MRAALPNLAHTDRSTAVAVAVSKGMCRHRTTAMRSSNSSVAISGAARISNEAASSNFAVGSKVFREAALHALECRVADEEINVRLSGLCRQARVK